MLENLKLIRKSVKNGIYPRLKNDSVRTLIELNDPELICLFIAANKNLSLDQLNILINAIKINDNRDNIKWIDTLIKILKNKPVYIQYEFANEISELEKISDRYAAYKIHRSNLF